MRRISLILNALLLSLIVPSCRHEPVPSKIEQPTQSTDKASYYHVGENGELTSPTITAGIDLTKFDQLGHFDCRQWAAADSVKRSSFYEKRKETALERVRALIWSRWQQQKPSYLRVTYDSIDATTTYHIFIDLDEMGQRQLILRPLCNYAPGNGYPPIYHLEYRGTEKKPSALLFKDNAGTTIASL